MPTPATPSTGDRSRPLPCGFCGFPIPGDPVSRHGEGGRAFCSETCADAFEPGEATLADGETFTLFRPGVSVLDSLLPRGIPRNSSVLLAGEEGVRHRGLQTELLWRTLQRGERAIAVSFLDSPVAIVAEFLSFGWNVLPYLESGDLRIVDCLTNRLREQHREPDRRTAGNAHVERFLEGTVSTVREPNDLAEVETKLHDAVDEFGLDNSGLITIDSINEAGVQGREFRTEQFFEEIRSDVAKRFFVPMFTSTTITEQDQFAKRHAYIFDGIVDMRHDEGFHPDVRLKRISVRKMDGVQYRPDWVAYHNRGRQGFVGFDPRTEFERLYPAAAARQESRQRATPQEGRPSPAAAPPPEVGPRNAPQQ